MSSVFIIIALVVGLAMGGMFSLNCEQEKIEALKKRCEVERRCKETWRKLYCGSQEANNRIAQENLALRSQVSTLERMKQGGHNE